jgi:hypothetical protein
MPGRALAVALGTMDTLTIDGTVLLKSERLQSSGY